MLREWTNKDHKDLPKGKKPRGNIIWKNLSKYKVPKEITEKETARVKEERRRGVFPKKISDIWHRLIKNKKQ